MNNNNNNQYNPFAGLNDIWKELNTVDISEELQTGYSPLPLGWYFCQVEKVEFKKTKETHKDMVMMQLSVVGVGYDPEHQEDGQPIPEIENVNNRKIFKNFLLSDAKQVTSFISDMKKFEDSIGVKSIPEDYFVDAQLLIQAAQNLVGRYIWMAFTENKNNPDSPWLNVKSWKAAQFAGLDWREE